MYILEILDSQDFSIQLEHLSKTTFHSTQIELIANIKHATSEPVESSAFKIPGHIVADNVIIDKIIDKIQKAEIKTEIKNTLQAYFSGEPYFSKTMLENPDGKGELPENL